MPTFGEVLAHEVKFRQPRRLPWQKKQFVQVTAIKATRLQDGNLGNPKKDVLLVNGGFPEALGMAQSKFAGRMLQINTIDTRPGWLKDLQENAKVAEEQMATAIEGQES